MTHNALAPCLILSAALALGGCGSSRFSGASPVASAQARPGPVYNAPAEPVTPVPSGPVTSAPLPPPGAPGPVAGVEPLAPAPAAPGPVASLTPTPVPAPAAAAPSGRSAYVGAWTAREASGSCRVQLSSSPSLDLYKASASGCANKDLARVNAWDFRDGEVYLCQPGGAVAARLRASGGALDGVIAKSGAPLALAR
jgi:Protease inhibitor Inh